MIGLLIALGNVGTSAAYTAVITAYNENDGDTPGTTMANGSTVRYGALANDVLPLGTKVLIQGEIFEVCDRFGGDHGIERFDMYLPTVDQCKAWGVREIEVEILEED